MRFTPAALVGACLIDPEPAHDERGFFARTFCTREFRDHGLHDTYVQQNVSYNRARGTLRGLHYQVPPAAEAKVVRCVRGAIHDVTVDLRPDSPTYLQHLAVELSATNRRALYIPPLLAHGFITLVDDTEVEYLMGEFHRPDCARGVRHDDPVLKLAWPVPIAVISPQDASWPDFPFPLR